MENEKSIAIMNNYPETKFNSLIPIKTLQELSPLHKVVINQVQINPAENKKEVYKEKNGELALTKKGLAKLMTAANIQMVESKSVVPQKCTRCIQMAEKTKQVPKCYECPFQDDVTYQVTLAVPEPSGTWRKVVATKEIRMADAVASMSEKQYKGFFPFRTEQCETKALNRALREALMINSTYKAVDLQKPFVVAYIVPNMADEDMKKVMIQKYAESSSALFGITENKKMLSSETKEISETTIIPPDESDNHDNENIVEGEVLEGVPGFYCDTCKKIIEDINEQWTAESIVEYSKKKFKGAQLCSDCQHEALEASRKAKAGDK